MSAAVARPSPLPTSPASATVTPAPDQCDSPSAASSASALPKLSASARADARLLSQQKHYIALQKSKIEEWKRTVLEYKLWHNKVTEALKTKHAAELAQVANKKDEQIHQLEERLQRAEANVAQQKRELESTLCTTCSANTSTATAAASVSSLNDSTTSTESSPSSAVVTPLSTSLSALISPDSLQAVARSSSQLAVVRPASAPAGQLSTTVFPRALTVEDDATVDEHVANLFAQVGALKGRLAAVKKPQPRVITTTTTQRTPPRLAPAKDDGSIVAASATPAPIRQHARSESKSTATIESSLDASVPSVLSLNTTTQSLVNTTSIDDAAAGSMLSTTSQHCTSLSSRSQGFDEFVAEINNKVAAYHETIHRLKAQVEHLQAKAKRSEEALQLKTQEAESQEQQLEEMRTALQQFTSRVNGVQKTIVLPSLSDAQHEQQPERTVEFARNFFGVLYAFIVQLCSNQRDLTDALGRAEATIVELRAALANLQAKAAESDSTEFRLRVDLVREQTATADQVRANTTLQEQINMLQFCLESERNKALAHAASSKSKSPIKTAAAAAPAPQSYTILPDYTSSSTIKIPHLPLSQLLAAQERSQPKQFTFGQSGNGSPKPRSSALSICTDSDSGSDDDDEIEIIEEHHVDPKRASIFARAASQQRQQVEEQKCSDSIPSAVSSQASSQFRMNPAGYSSVASGSIRAPRQLPAGCHTTYFALPPPNPSGSVPVTSGYVASPPLIPSLTGESRFAHTVVGASGYCHARAVSVSVPAGAQAPKQIPSPTSAFKLVMRTPFASAGTAAASKPPPATAAAAAAPSASSTPTRKSSVWNKPLDPRQQAGYPTPQQMAQLHARIHSHAHTSTLLNNGNFAHATPIKARSHSVGATVRRNTQPMYCATQSTTQKPAESQCKAYAY